MSPVFRHGALRLYLLKMLGEQPRHGYEVISLLEDRFLGLYAPSAGTVYPRLARLESEGLVEHEERDGRKVYSLTEAGRRELDRSTEALSSLEHELTQSVSEMARDVRAQVRTSVQDLRAELKQAARDVRREARASARHDHRARPELEPLATEIDALCGVVRAHAHGAREDAVAAAAALVRRCREEVANALRAHE